jgi:nucleoside-diphosphate-sugar epimerase
VPVDENHPISPIDINGINKNAGEQYHLLYNDVYGIRSSVLRLTNTYGPGMRIKDSRQTFIGIWVKNILKNKTIEVWGGDQIRDFNYVDDVVNAFLSVAMSNDSDGQIFNLGSKEFISLHQLANLLISVNGSGSFEIKSFPKERKKIDIGNIYSDYSKINNLLSWEPTVNLEKGIKLTLDYYKSHGEHYLEE